MTKGYAWNAPDKRDIEEVEYLHMGDPDGKQFVYHCRTKDGRVQEFLHFSKTKPEAK